MIPRCTHIWSHGVLKLLNREEVLVHLDFEEIIPLQERQVIGMRHDDEDESLVAKRITIRGKISKHSIPNQGTFGRTLILIVVVYFFFHFFPSSFTHLS